MRLRYVSNEKRGSPGIDLISYGSRDAYNMIKMKLETLTKTGG